MVDAAEHAHDQQIDGEVERKRRRADKTQIVDVQRAGQACQCAAQGKDPTLIERGVDADRRRGDLATADGGQRASDS